MPVETLAQIRSLPEHLQQNALLRRRQYIRQELNTKIHQLREIQEKRIFYIKCPCNFDMCTHMDPLTADLHMDFCPLKTELDFFFMRQEWAYLGVYVYPHCIECNEWTLCGDST